MEYLGHVVDGIGNNPTEDKVRVIKEAPVPKDITQLRAFVGFINYYGKFILQVATHMAPLYKLMEKNHKWSWTEECHNAYLK